MSGGLTSYLGQTLQLVLGAVFLTAAVTKLRNPLRFVAAMRAYELLPRVLTQPLAVSLIVIESLLGISLLWGWMLDVSVPAAGVLLLAFGVAVGVNLRRGRVVPCGCFGSVSERISTRTLARLGLLLLAAIGLEVLRITSSFPPLNVANLATSGSGGVDRLVVTAAFGASLTVVSAWLLHIPEIRLLLRRLSNGM